jgi:uncharacterized protein YcbX
MSLASVASADPNRPIREAGWELYINHNKMGGGTIDVVNLVQYDSNFQFREVDSSEFEVEVGGITVKFMLTVWRNNLENPEDMLEVIDIEDGWMAWPAQLTLPEPDENNPEVNKGQMRIILNAMS